MLNFTYGFLAFYYLWFFCTLCKNLSVIMDLETSTVVIFCFSQGVHFLFICGVLLGIFSRHFENGGVQMFFYAMCNIYVYALAYLSWPIEVIFKEYEIDENIHSLD